MPYLTPKPKQAMAWISTQVQYGIDTSDPDPANWKAFGQLADEQEAKAAAEKTKHGVKAPQPAQ